MIYRKFKGRALFTGNRLLTGGEVLVTDENGIVMDIVGGGDISDAETLDGIITPGFVNAHCHLELSWMKGMIEPGSGMVDFLLSVMQKTRPSATEISDAARMAEAEMLKVGIIAVGDICNTTATTYLKREGNLYYHNFIEAMGFVDAAAAQRFSQAMEVFKEFAAGYEFPMASNSIVPHAPYSVSETLFRRIVDFPGNQLLSIHNQEHPAENEFFLEGTGDFHRLFKAIGVDTTFHKGSGKTSLQTYMPWFRRNQAVILVHNVEMNRQDMEFLQESASNGVAHWLCLCPNANRYINRKLPEITALAPVHDRIIIGTDSLASNTSLSIIEELKTISQVYPQIPVDTLLMWATINGAKALNLDEEVGSFEKGKTPGIVLVRGLDGLQLDDSTTALRLL